MLLAFSKAGAEQPSLCVTQHFAELKKGSSLGITRTVAENLVSRISASISFPNKIQVVYCQYVDRARAYAPKGVPDVPDGEYITVNQIWLREVLGEDEVQAIALLGHEIGHYSGRHFESRSNISLHDKETEADRAAGCAVARLSGKFSKVEDLFSRLRAAKAEGGYPSRAQSLAAAREGFKNCGGESPAPPPTRPVVVTPPSVTINDECQKFDCSKP